VIRLRITAAVLADARTTGDIEALLQPLAGHAMKAFDEDYAKVVTAMLGTKVPGEARTVKELISFEEHNEDSADYAAQNAADNAAITTWEIRELVAAVVRAYVADPSAFDRNDGKTPSADHLLRAAMRTTIHPGIRNVPAIEAQQSSVADHAQLDQQRGEQLLAALRKTN
jgi:hypothetical protein